METEEETESWYIALKNKQVMLEVGASQFIFNDYKESAHF